jgi:hypothetical protein
LLFSERGLQILVYSARGNPCAKNRPGLACFLSY